MPINLPRVKNSWQISHSFKYCIDFRLTIIFETHEIQTISRYSNRT